MTAVAYLDEIRSEAGDKLYLGPAEVVELVGGMPEIRLPDGEAFQAGRRQVEGRQVGPLPDGDKGGVGL